jgi:hypothetical protein
MIEGRRMNIDVKQWADYYSDESNLTKIANACKYREVIVIKHLEDHNVPIRPLKIFKPEHLKFWIERLSLKTTIFDLYISNASVKMPALTSDIKQLDTFRKYLTEHWAELVTGYDIFVDMDIENEDQRESAKTWSIKIEHILEQQYPNVEIWDTTRGYHTICKGQFNPEFVKELIQDICCENGIPMSFPIKDKDGIRYIAKNNQWVELKPNEEIDEPKKPNCDTRIYDARRIRRVPYSLHSKTGKPMVRLQ